MDFSCSVYEKESQNLIIFGLIKYDSLINYKDSIFNISNTIPAFLIFQKKKTYYLFGIKRLP